jgi:hypothetical protein
LTAAERVAEGGGVRNTSVDTFQNEVADWANATFPKEHMSCGPVIDHLRDELDEVEADPTNIEEWADVLLLILHGTRNQGILFSALLDQARSKHAINVARKWGKPDSRGVVRHEESV